MNIYLNEHIHIMEKIVPRHKDRNSQFIDDSMRIGSIHKSAVESGGSEQRRISLLRQAIEARERGAEEAAINGNIGAARRYFKAAARDWLGLSRIADEESRSAALDNYLRCSSLSAAHDIEEMRRELFLSGAMRIH